MIFHKTIRIISFSQEKSNWKLFKQIFFLNLFIVEKKIIWEVMLSNMSTSALKVLSFYIVSLNEFIYLSFIGKIFIRKISQLLVSFKLDYLFKWHVNSIFFFVLQQETFWYFILKLQNLAYTPLYINLKQQQKKNIFP